MPNYYFRHSSSELSRLEQAKRPRIRHHNLIRLSVSAATTRPTPFPQSVSSAAFGKQGDYSLLSVEVSGSTAEIVFKEC